MCFAVALIHIGAIKQKNTKLKTENFIFHFEQVPTRSLGVFFSRVELLFPNTVFVISRMPRQNSGFDGWGMRSLLCFVQVRTSPSASELFWA